MRRPKKVRVRVAYEDQTKEERALILEKKEKKATRSDIFWKNFARFFKFLL